MHSRFPFRSPGIIHLWPLGMTDACVNMIYSRQSEIQCFGLILQEAFTHITPMGDIEGHTQSRNFINVLTTRGR